MVSNRLTYPRCPKPRLVGAINPLLVTLLIPVIAIGITLYVWLSRSRALTDTQEFPYRTYIESPASLEGNRYRLDAEITAQLAWDEQTGRLLAVQLLDSAHRLAVFIPAGRADSLHTGQRYRFQVRVLEQGLIEVEALSKP
jgi:hypothetical protein